MKLKSTEFFYKQIINLLHEARKTVVRDINSIMVTTYYQIGKMIVEKEQQGKKRADYGKELIKNLSIYLQKEFGSGYSERNLEQMRKFFLCYQISQTVSAKSKQGISQAHSFKLSWSHYQILIRMEDRERKFYEIEAVENNFTER